MSLKIVRDVNGAAVEVLTLDAVIAHQIELTSSLTEHALEDGTTVVDHVIRQPDQVTVTGYVSSFPVTILTGGIVPIRNFGRAKTAYQALKELMEKPERVSIQDALDQYSSMILTELRIPRDLATYNGIQFTGTFRKARFVATAEVEISTDDPIAKEKADVGAVTPEDATTEETAQISLLYRASKRGADALAELLQ